MYAGEAAHLEFEPEREFETLTKEEQVLVSGEVDLVHLDDPLRVALIDFESDGLDSEAASSLDGDEKWH